MDSRVVIVDDDAQDRAVMMEVARSCDFVVLEAASGWDLRKALREWMVDAVVLDVILAGEDAFDVLRDMVAAHSRVPIVLVTAFGTRVLKPALDLGRAYGLNMVGDGLHKPLHLPHFDATLRRIRASL